MFTLRSYGARSTPSIITSYKHCAPTELRSNFITEVLNPVLESLRTQTSKRPQQIKQDGQVDRIKEIEIDAPKFCSYPDNLCPSCSFLYLHFSRFGSFMGALKTRGSAL